MQALNDKIKYMYNYRKGEIKKIYKKTQIKLIIKIN